MLMKRIWLFFTALMVFLAANVALAQPGQVSGTVKDAGTGEGIPFASVMEKGTMNGVAAGADGYYTIRVSSPDAVLVFSSVGYNTVELSPGRAAVLNVLLEVDNVLEETIVVAFGTQTKSSFTGSATVMDSEELSKKIVTNVADALVGATPGLQIRGSSGAPGADAGSINIRGISSLYLSTDPLIIVDGAPYSASLTNIPQADVESITVLKDAASAALYGARGANGVIIVTTKNGSGKKAQINIDMKWGFDSRAVQRYKTINDPAGYYEAIYAQYYNYYANQGQTLEQANKNANSLMMTHLVYQDYTIPDGQMLIGTNGKLNPNATYGYAYTNSGETYWVQGDDWQDAAYSNAFRQEYNVNITGSNDRGSYYASVGYLDQEGIISPSDYSRITARLKADYQATEWFKIGANVGFVNGKTTSNPNYSTSWNSTNLAYYATFIAPIYPIYVRVLDADGNVTIRTDENGNPQYDYGVAASNYPGLSRPFLSTGNPLGSNKYNKVTGETLQMNGTFTTEVKFTDWLKFNTTNTIDWTSEYDSDYQTMLYGPKVSVGGQLDKTTYRYFRQNYVQTLTFNKSFDDHNVTIMVGHEWYDTQTSYLYAYATGLFSEDILELSAAANPVTSSSSKSEYDVEGYFANAQYNFKEKYFGSASYRRDASSRFAKENRWGDFWSVGGAWLIEKEKWFTAPWVDQLKLKVSIGQQGNDNLGSTPYYIDTYTLSAASETQMSPTFYVLGNPDITWETTTNMNAGVEFSLFNGRLSGEVDFYNKKTTDLLFWLSIPESNGSRGYYGNMGDVRNYGFEISLSGDVIRKKNIVWNISANISHNKDKILSLPESKLTSYGGFYESGYWYKVGGSMYNYMTYSYAGVDPDTGLALYWVDEELGEGVTSYAAHNKSYTTTSYSKANRYEQGSLLPWAYGGLSTTVKLWNFDISVTFDYQLGGEVYDSQYQSLMANNSTSSDAGSAVHVDVLKSWSATNTSSDIPRWQYGDSYTASTSDRWLTDASYLNFQSFTVGYTVPSKYLEKFLIQNLRVYVAGENLTFWSARRGFDPRYSYSSTSATTAYSPTRTIMGGIQITF